MGVPAVFNITPATVPTSGRTLIQIYGDNFRLPSLPVTAPSVEVLFDSEPAEEVGVIRTNRLSVLVPKSPIPAVRVRMKGSPDLTFADTDPDTIVRSAGDWVADGFRAGMRILVTGSTSNDTNPETGPVNYLVASVTASTLTLGAGVSLTAEGPSSSVSVQSPAYGEGKVTLTIRNLDDNGDPIGGEEVVIPDAVLFRRVQLSQQSDLTRLCRMFLREVRRQVIPNVSLTTHTDFDSETGDLLDLVDLAEVPGIALIGPDLITNRLYSLNKRQPRTLPSGERVLVRAPTTVDLEFTVLGVTNHKFEHLNLQTVFEQFMERNPYIFLDRDPADASKGRVKFELAYVTDNRLQVAGGANASNLRTFSGTLLLRGFDIEDLTGFPDEMAMQPTAEVEEINTDIVQTGVTYNVGPSPGPGGNC